MKIVICFSLIVATSFADVTTPRKGLKQNFFPTTEQPRVIKARQTSDFNTNSGAFGGSQPNSFGVNSNDRLGNSGGAGYNRFGNTGSDPFSSSNPNDRFGNNPVGGSSNYNDRFSSSPGAGGSSNPNLGGPGNINNLGGPGNNNFGGPGNNNNLGGPGNNNLGGPNTGGFGKTGPAIINYVKDEYSARYKININLGGLPWANGTLTYKDINGIIYTVEWSADKNGFTSDGPKQLSGGSGGAYAPVWPIRK